MRVVAETDVKKDARNRVTLPTADFEHYHVMTYDDGHIELYPRVLTDPLISQKTLHMIDAAMTNLENGNTGSSVDADALLRALAQ
jgi:hypothetical protein